eukprot:UN23351
MSKRLPRMKFLHDLVGTPYYTAPEVISGKYSTAADLWSIGVVLYVMLFGYPPFYVEPETHGHLEHEEIYKQIQAGFIPKVKKGYGAWFPDFIPVSKNAKDLISKMLRQNPAERPTALEALEHPWLHPDGHTSKPIGKTILNSLGNFNKVCAFSTAVCITFLDWLRTDEYEAAKKAFESMDQDGDGNITYEEFKTALVKHTTVSERRCAKMFGNVDINGDHVIKYKELVTALTHEHLRANDERLHHAFSELDANEDGVITPEELGSVMSSHKLRVNEKTINHFIKTADANGDGKIDFQEFLRAISPEL